MYIMKLIKKNQIFIALAMMFVLSITSYAAPGDMASNVSTLLEKILDAIKYLIILSGAIFVFVGGLHVAKSDAESDPASKEKGWKQIISGLGVILIGWFGIPYLVEFMKTIFS